MIIELLEIYIEDDKGEWIFPRKSIRFFADGKKVYCEDLRGAQILKCIIREPL